jgi:hypothetical protein
MSNNYWLFYKLKHIPGVFLQAQFDPLIVAEKNGTEYRIYTPSSTEYMIDVDIVQKAREMDANVISFPTKWCRASSEAISYGKLHKIQVIPHGKLFEILSS